MNDRQEYLANWRAENKPRIAARDRARQIATRDWMRDIQAQAGCKTCGEKDPIVLQFHHRDGETKSFNISTASSRSRKSLTLEIAKCDILCANCHMRHHYAPEST